MIVNANFALQSTNLELDRVIELRKTNKSIKQLRFVCVLLILLDLLDHPTAASRRRRFQWQTTGLDRLGDMHRSNQARRLLRELLKNGEAIKWFVKLMISMKETNLESGI